MTQVDIKINSVNFICDWKYNVQSDKMSCCFCKNNLSNQYQLKAQQNHSFKIYGLVSGKCGHIAHLSCYKSRIKKNNNFCYCFNCDNIQKFEFDKILETNHTQKLYRV